MSALDIALDLIKAHEGCKLIAYQDVAGIWTCGWGATGLNINSDTIWTQEIADERLKSDVLNALNAVKRNAKVSLTDKQLGALTSFVFNLGEGNFKSSTLLTLLNQSDFIGAAEQLPKWCRAGGRKVKGLLIRRFNEASLFLQGS